MDAVREGILHIQPAEHRGDACGLKRRRCGSSSGRVYQTREDTPEDPGPRRAPRSGEPVGYCRPQIDEELPRLRPLHRRLRHRRLDARIGAQHRRAARRALSAAYYEDLSRGNCDAAWRSGGNRLARRGSCVAGHPRRSNSQISALRRQGWIGQRRGSSAGGRQDAARAWSPAGNSMFGLRVAHLGH